MRFHIVNLPHTSTTHEYDSCAYTAKVRKFCDMMYSLGHEVFLYATDENDALVTELVPIMTKERQQYYFGTQGKQEFYNITWDPKDAHWQDMNNAAIREIGKRIQQKDFICIIAGTCQQQIAEAFPNHLSVEYGIGYSGTFSKYRIFESYSHMHYVHGDQRDDNGNFYDAVIPNYYDVAEFPYAEKKEDYFLFVGRLIPRKGLHIAQEVCEKLGKRLVVAGQGEFSGYGEYVGVIDAKHRGELMSKARALFVPTTYLEPFGGVHAEALLCGTPVITTNFGVFTETVENGVNGWRCNDFSDFLAAAGSITDITPGDRRDFREDAQQRFGMQHVRYEYNRYFKQLLKLWKKGWYELD